MEAAMENVVGNLFPVVALALEGLAGLMVAIGGVKALYGILAGLLASNASAWKRRIWLEFATWIVLALEFALAADIVRSLLAPSWDELGRLAVVAGLRTFLSYFVWRDLDEVEHVSSKPERPDA